jgi:formate dehydrogenase maturation protein FdhE
MQAYGPMTPHFLSILETKIASDKDALDLRSLQKELEFYKWQSQLLSQKNVMLEKELHAVSDQFEQYKKEMEEREMKLLAGEFDEDDSQSEDSGVANSGCKSTEMCRHFLKGRCRYKGMCKFSHEISICPYCSRQLPAARIAASTHLSRCYKLHRSSLRAAAENVEEEETLVESTDNQGANSSDEMMTMEFSS